MCEGKQAADKNPRTRTHMLNTRGIPRAQASSLRRTFIATHLARIESCLHTKTVISVTQLVLMLDLLQRRSPPERSRRCEGKLGPPRLISWGLNLEHFQSFTNFPRPGFRLSQSPGNNPKRAAVSLNIKMPPYYMSRRGKRMSEVVLCYLETLPGILWVHWGEASSMNAVAFLQSFLEVSVVWIISCSEVDPCPGEGC